MLSWESLMSMSIPGETLGTPIRHDVEVIFLGWPENSWGSL